MSLICNFFNMEQTLLYFWKVVDGEASVSRLLDRKADKISTLHVCQPGEFINVECHRTVNVPTESIRKERKFCKRAINFGDYIGPP